MSENVDTSRQALIDDLKKLIEKNGKVTRDYYREHGSFSEKFIAKHFTSFKEFVASAGEIHTVEPETQEWQGNTWTVTLPKTRIHSLDELIEKFKIDTQLWTVDRFIANAWEMGYKNSDGEGEAFPLYQVKATFVKRQFIEDARIEIEDLKREAKEFARIPSPIVRSDRQSGNSLELLIPDLHAGKFAWSRETGHADYDTPKAIATYEKAVDAILDRAAGYKFDEILLGVGNDLLNSDDYNSQTTKGTLVNSDTRYPKTYKAVRQMLVRTIEKLRLIAPVKVKVIPGNHDNQSTFTLGDSLECWFHAFPDVEIDNSPNPHKFYTWGKVLLGFTHGDKGKKTDYGLWMATEQPQSFGNSLFREIHIGHTHGLKVDEKFGVRVRTFSALCPPDAWHASNMLLGNLQQAEAIVWNKEVGRIAEFIYTELD
jgi:hypothetical protein